MDTILLNTAIYLSINELHRLKQLCSSTYRLFSHDNKTTWVYLVSNIPPRIKRCIRKNVGPHRFYLFCAGRMRPFIGMHSYSTPPNAYIKARLHYVKWGEGKNVMDYYYDKIKAKLEDKINGINYRAMVKCITYPEFLAFVEQKSRSTFDHDTRFIRHYLISLIQKRELNKFKQYTALIFKGNKIITSIESSILKYITGEERRDWMTEFNTHYFSDSSVQTYNGAAFGKLVVSDTLPTNGMIEQLNAETLKFRKYFLKGACQEGRLDNIAVLGKFLAEHNATETCYVNIGWMKNIATLKEAQKWSLCPPESSVYYHTYIKSLLVKLFMRLELDGLDQFDEELLHSAYEKACIEFFSNYEYDKLYNLVELSKVYYRGDIDVVVSSNGHRDKMLFIQGIDYYRGQARINLA